MRLEKTKVQNKKDYDISVKDAFGNEHVLFPQEEKEIIVLVSSGKKNGPKSINRRSSS
jgi:hypothetical protein